MGIVINIKDHERLSFEQCKKELLKDGEKISDEDVKKIVDFLYILADISYNIYVRKINEKKSNTLSAGIHRRAG